MKVLTEGKNETHPRNNERVYDDKKFSVFCKFSIQN